MKQLPSNQGLFAIQARTGSTRLPGKVLMHLGTRTILGVILYKLIATGIPPNRIIVCTSSRESDLAICAEASAYQVCSFQGAENDVLDRMAKATCAAGDGDFVVRLTADNPFFDVQLMLDLIELLQERRLSYAMPKGCAIGAGVEVFTAGALRVAQAEATVEWHREHVTPFLRENLAKFPAGMLPVVPDRSAHRLTIDTDADLTLARALYALLGEELLGASQERICQCLDVHPDLGQINSHVEQRTR